MKFSIYNYKNNKLIFNILKLVYLKLFKNLYYTQNPASAEGIRLKYNSWFNATTNQIKKIFFKIIKHYLSSL